MKSSRFLRVFSRGAGFVAAEGAIMHWLRPWGALGASHYPVFLAMIQFDSWLFCEWHQSVDFRWRF